MITVVKLGGNIIDNEDQLKIFLREFASLDGKKILVHGGGKSATAFSEKLGVKAEMKNGRRVTDAETLKLITMMYAGWLNKNIVAQLQGMNCNAIGLSGADGNLITSEKRSPLPIDYGFVGDPLENEINAALFLKLLDSDYVPVIAPVTHDGKGQLLNTNADTIASVIAIALSQKEKVQLLYCFEKNGVLENADDDKSVLPKLNSNQTATLSAAGKIHSGMLPKLKAGFHAKAKGVHRVCIGNAMELKKTATENSECTLLEI